MTDTPARAGGEGAGLSSRARWLTLVAMTLSGSMILVDQTSVPLAVPHIIEGLHGDLSDGQWVLTANVLALAAFMVVGGKLGDLFGLRRVFLIGALIFVVSSALAGAAQDVPWLIAVRGTQGVGAALMMPTSVAIVSNVFPADVRGRALGIFAGASAFFAALGPVLGGLLTAIDWRLVFFINVPLAVITILLTLAVTPRLAPDPDSHPRIDWIGTATFAIGIGALVLGLGQGQSVGWGDPGTVIPLGLGVVALTAFVVIEFRVAEPLIEFRLFRHLNFLAANVSQFLAGMIELGLGYLTPIFLLLVIGFGPAAAGIALIPASLPVILAGPLAGRAFDRVGGRWPLVIGFLVLAASGVALSLAVSEDTYAFLIPGLVLQGLGLGIVLTTNDPTGLTAVDENERGQAAGVINTTEQLGGAVGIAALTAFELTVYYGKIRDILEHKVSSGSLKVYPGQSEFEKAKDLVLEAEQKGANALGHSKFAHQIFEVLVPAKIDAFQITFLVTAGIAIVGAIVCFALVRKGDPVKVGPIFSRRSRWVYTVAGRGPALRRQPGSTVEHLRAGSDPEPSGDGP